MASCAFKSSQRCQPGKHGRGKQVADSGNVVRSDRKDSEDADNIPTPNKTADRRHLQAGAYRHLVNTEQPSQREEDRAMMKTVDALEMEHDPNLQDTQGNVHSSQMTYRLENEMKNINDSTNDSER